MAQKTCILCGLEIPPGKENREHFMPRSRTIKAIWNDPRNIFWAHYMLNAVKADYLPCEFFEMKYDLTYNAIKHWRMPPEDREFLARAIKNWDVWNPNPCALCLAKCHDKQK